MIVLPNGGEWYNPGEDQSLNTQQDIDYIRQIFEDAKTRVNGAIAKNIEYGKGKPFYSCVLDGINSYECTQRAEVFTTFKVTQL